MRRNQLRQPRHLFKIQPRYLRADYRGTRVRRYSRYRAHYEHKSSIMSTENVHYLRHRRHAWVATYPPLFAEISFSPLLSGAHQLPCPLAPAGGTVETSTRAEPRADYITELSASHSLLLRRSGRTGVSSTVPRRDDFEPSAASRAQIPLSPSLFRTAARSALIFSLSLIAVTNTAAPLAFTRRVVVQRGGYHGTRDGTLSIRRRAVEATRFFSILSARSV